MKRWLAGIGAGTIALSLILAPGASATDTSDQAAGAASTTHYLG